MEKKMLVIVLKEFQDLIRSAILSKTDPDDISGFSTVYIVDHERLMGNIEARIGEIEEEIRTWGSI